jgi:hypothetical protein
MVKKSNQRSHFRTWQYGLFLFFSVFFLFAVTELLLRLFWNNPYIPDKTNSGYTRFHQKGITAFLRIEKLLYSGGGKIRFAIDDKMAISDGSGQKQNQTAIALGGSTTENVLVPEGLRWPDLLVIPTLNYGVGGNSSVDGYYNLRFLIEKEIMKLTDVFLMYVTNDLRALLRKGSDMFIIEGWNEQPDDRLSLFDNPDQKVLFGLRIRDSAILSFIKFNFKNIIGRTRFYETYLSFRKTQDTLEQLTQDEFNSFLRSFRLNFLPKRIAVYSEIDSLANRHGVNLIFLTQPNSYRKDFRPFHDDLRLFPVYNKKKMTLEQAALVMKILNNQNRKLARALNRQLIDVEACFSSLDPSPLFYDSIHYTVRGSRQFAECVNNILKDK